MKPDFFSLTYLSIISTYIRHVGSELNGVLLPQMDASFLGPKEDFVSAKNTHDIAKQRVPEELRHGYGYSGIACALQ